MANHDYQVRPLGVLHVIKLHQAGAHIIDMRSPGDFARVHLQGSLSPTVSDWELDLRRVRASVMPVVVIASPGPYITICARHTNIFLAYGDST